MMEEKGETCTLTSTLLQRCVHTHVDVIDPNVAFGTLKKSFDYHLCDEI